MELIDKKILVASLLEAIVPTRFLSDDDRAWNKAIKHAIKVVRDQPSRES